MNNKCFASLVVLTLLFIGQSQAGAAPLVYDNGAIYGFDGGLTISQGFEVSNSFTVLSATTLGSVTAGLWVDPTDTPLSVNWAIGTSPFGSDVSFGSSTLSNTYFGPGFGGQYDIYSSLFSISGTAAPGTYYLTLGGAVTSLGFNNVYWDTNNGPAVAYQFNPSGFVDSGLPSNAFQVYSANAPEPVPEPATFTLLGLGLAGLAVRRWRQKA